MLFERPDAFSAEQLRGEVAGALRKKREALAGALVPRVAAESQLALTPQAARRIAQLILEMLATSVEFRGERTGNELLRELQALLGSTATARDLFGCVHVCERAVLDELAVSEILGAISQPWPHVTQMVRRASVDVLASSAEAVAAARENAVQDPLTALVSLPVFQIALDRELNRARRRKQPLSTILIDVHNLAHINAQQGYGVGDRVLERLAILVLRYFRLYDWVARHGQRSILVLLPETGVQAAVDLAAGVRDAIEQRLIFTDLRTSQRVGVELTAAAVGTEPVDAGLDAAALITAAEAGIKRARESGSRQVERIHLQSSAVTLLDAAGLLKCTPFDVRRLVRAGRLTAERRGRRVYVNRASLERLQRSCL
jgi:diguanylate cyclase (GGDEF)-like protein